MEEKTLADDAHMQVYDNIIKRLFERHAKEIIPLLLAENNLASIENNKAMRATRPILEEDEKTEVEELNIETLIPPRRNDRVYRVPYKGRIHIVDMEIETSPNSHMPIRSLIYHALHLEKYGPPIISLIFYPFQMTIVRSPLREINGDGEAIIFHFRTFPLWEMDAHTYFERGNLCMYAFLPAMKGATKEMLFQALDRMVQYYRGSSTPLIKITTRLKNRQPYARAKRQHKYR